MTVVTDNTLPGGARPVRTETRVVHVPVPVRSRRWPGVLIGALLGAALAAVAVSSYYDQRSLGARLDASVAAAETGVRDQVSALQGAASSAAGDTAKAGGRVADVLGDAGITGSVKAALAADPSLSALKIDVTTQAGVVRLDGPAPDEKSRQRAEVLAAAPQGVTRVDNRLVVATTARQP